MTGKGDKRLHARTQADADAMAAKWAATFGPPTAEHLNKYTGRLFALPTLENRELTDAERDAMWRAGTHIQRGRDK